MVGSQQPSTDERDQGNDCTEAWRAISFLESEHSSIRYYDEGFLDYFDYFNLDSNIYTACNPRSRMDSTESTGDTTTVAQIRAVAMTVREPKNAGEIADIAGVARNTAEKYLTQLVETNILTTVQHGRETCYYPDPVTQYFNQIRELVETHQKDDLTAELAAIREDIEEWKKSYAVDSPDELRTSVGDEIPAAERRQRQQDAADWEYYEHQATLIKQAIQLYDTIETTRDQRVAP